LDATNIVKTRPQANEIIATSIKTERIAGPWVVPSNPRSAVSKKIGIVQLPRLPRKQKPTTQRICVQFRAAAKILLKFTLVCYFELTTSSAPPRQSDAAVPYMK